MFQQKGPPKGKPRFGKGKGKSKQKGKGKTVPAHYFGLGLYTLETVDGKPDFYANEKQDPANQNVTIAPADPLQASLEALERDRRPIRSHLAGNSFGKELGVYENEAQDVFNENVPLEAFDDPAATIPPNSNGTTDMELYMMQSIGVMQVGAAPALGQGECPKFILDTGATENAAGVNTLQQLLQWGRGVRLRHVDLEDRPVFRFGDGLTLKATSKVVLGCTSLGTISFYVLDGDNRRTTQRAQDTPLLVGSRFLHNHRACISYEHLSLFLMKRREK